MEKYEEEMIKVLDSKKELTERQLRDILEYEIEQETGENRRWSRSNNSICKVADRYFSLTWEEGLTEMQDNEFYSQPFEVKLIEEEKMIKVVQRTWNKI